MKIFRIYLKNKETKYHMACDKIKFRIFKLQFILLESSRKGEGNGEIFRRQISYPQTFRRATCDP